MDWFWIIVIGCLVGALALIKLFDLIGKALTWFFATLVSVLTEIEDDEFPHRPGKNGPSSWEM